MQTANNANELIEEYISKKDIKYYEYKHFSNFQEIGIGGFGKVYSANWKSSKQRFALKSFHYFSNATIKELVRELEHQREVDFHCNIIRLFGITTPNQDNQNDQLKKYWLVLEYADGGALRNYLKNNFDRLAWNDKYNLAFQLASAVSCLHDEGIVHRDLHSGNILIHQGVIKLADFGLSKRIEEITSQSKVFGVIPYIDPKRFDKWRKYDNTSQPYTLNEKSDVYSIGVLLWEISSGRPPFYVEGEGYDVGLAIEILQGLRETNIPDTPKDYIKIYTECWDSEPDNRPAMNKVVDELDAIIAKTNITENYQINNAESSLQLSEQLTNSSINNNSLHGELSQIIRNFNQMDLESNETTVIINDDNLQLSAQLNNSFQMNEIELVSNYSIIYDDNIDSLRITELNKDLLYSLGELQRYRKLQVLDCSITSITSLPALPNSLKKLWCFDTQITILPTLPNSLTELYCTNTRITNLPTLPHSLAILYCNDTPITNLPTLPHSLAILYCNDTPIIILPTLPNSLKILYCYSTQITSLPTLTNSLTVLDCSNTQITILPTLPNSLTELYCYNTQITSLPILPNSLKSLWCLNTQINSLPNLPNSLTDINPESLKKQYFIKQSNFVN